MKIQNIVSDVRSRVESASKQYQGAFKAYIDAQRKALGVMTRNGQTLANTEIGAAKNVFAAAKSSFDKARTDGVRKIANNPQAYVPNGRDQIVSAYKDTIDLLVRTGNELTDVVSSGYKSVRKQLTTSKSTKSARTSRTTTAGRKKTATSTTAKKKAAPSKTTAKRKAASTRKSAAKPASGTTTAKRTTTKKAASASTANSSGSTAS